MCANSGYIDNRLKYLRSRQKSSSVELGAASINPFDFRETNEAINSIGDKAKEDVEFLKSVVVNKDNIELIRTKLSQTRQYRWNMLKNEQLYFRTEFPYFFTNPDLVSR